MPKLYWKNLADDKCPICGSMIYANDPGVTCSKTGCNFFITKEKLNKIKDDLSRQSIRYKEFEGYGFD